MKFPRILFLAAAAAVITGCEPAQPAPQPELTTVPDSGVRVL